MSSWLRNIQGQLTDLANEVLNEANDVLAEAREEVADPDTELVVAKKNCAEAVKQLAIESAKIGSLEEEKKQLEQQLYDAHVEMDTIGSKLNGMVRQRDEEIKKLKNQMEQIHESGWNEGGSDEDVVAELKSQVAHWKSLVEQGGDKEEVISLTELEKRLEEVRQRKEHEIQAIIESHAESMVELREMYEEKLSAMQVMPYNASSSTSNADTLDAVLLDKDELCKGKSSTNGSDVGDRPVVVDLGSHDELVDERIRQIEAELERCKEEKESLVESLTTQNEELAQAYDELNTEFEEFKERNAATENRNNDLNHRIDSLKANLIEYEERYELCRKENTETVAQLEKLSGDFERLRNGVANVSQRREDCDSMMNDEVEKLRNALDESRAERERLRNDVQGFQVAVGEIDVELEKLREANRMLLAENQGLTQNLSTYDQTMKDIISSSEKDIGHFREQFHDIQENHKKQRDAVMAENEALREESEAVKAQRDILMEESRLLKEVNEKLKQKSATEESKIELLAKKADLLQQVLDEEREERRKEKEEKKEKKEDDGEEEEKDASDQDKEIAILKVQLMEALEANSEKSEECEKLKSDARALEREVDLRQNCVDEMIAQTNTLQMQQETMSATNKTLQTQILLYERKIVQLEEEVKGEKAKVGQKEKKIETLEKVIVGEGTSEEIEETDPLGANVEEERDLQASRRYALHLKKKLEEVEEELKIVKELKSDENKEAAEVRKVLERDLFEAAEVDRGLLEGIEVRVQEMESQLEAKVVMLAKANEDREKAEEKVREVLEKVKAMQESHVESESSRSELENVKKSNEELLKTTQDLAQEIEVLKAENENLKGIATTHHGESVKYYEQCQAMAAQTEQLGQKFRELEAKLVNDSDSHEKRTKELQRLREHLMIVEETSTREAVESEQRETELRARVRELEARGHAVEEGASESTQQYQVQIASLTGKLESVERSAAEWKGKYESEVKAREQTQEALASLQNVVRELSVDHERDTAAASHRNLELQTQISALHEEMGQIREELDRQSISRQAAEEESERRNLQLASKQKIIEDLEVQIEELRSPTRVTDSYRIDDSTLRQLFLNYFTAEPAKRADVAMLLASILEYPPDEMDKFRSAVRQSFQQSGSSFFFGSRGSTPTGGSSISEQFIRFLEVESESSRTAPHLPVRAQSEAAHQISLDSPRQKSTSPQPSQASASSSAAALDSLLR